MNVEKINEYLEKLLKDYSEKPKSGKENMILAVLNLCPVYTYSDYNLITIEIKEKRKYKHYYPVYTHLTEDEINSGDFSIKGMLDVVNTIKYVNDNEWEEYNIDGIIINSNEQAIKVTLDKLYECKIYNTYKVIENMFWLDQNRLVKIDKAINTYLSNYKNRLVEGTEIEVEGKLVNLDIKPGELAIIGGRPSIGKSAVATDLMINEAMVNNGSIIYFSAEFPIKILTARIINEYSRIGMTSVLAHPSRISDEDYTRMEVSTRGIRKKNIYLANSYYIDIEEIEKTIKENLSKIKPTMIIVDYLQLIGSCNEESTDKNYEFVTEQLKRIAKETNTKMVVLSQLYRKIENRKDKRPKLTDIRGSSLIGEIADKVYMVYRDDYYSENSLKQENNLEIIKIKPEKDKGTKLYTLESGYIK